MGASVSGLQPVDTRVDYFSRIVNYPYVHPVGNTDLDTFHYRPCRDDVCIHDPTNSGNFLWESIRREGATQVHALPKIPSRPSFVGKTVGFPDTKVKLLEVDDVGKVKDFYTEPHADKSYVVRLDSAASSRFM